MRKKILLAIACVMLLVSSTAADPGDTLWTRTYGGSDWDRGYSVQQTSDGGYIIVGGTESFGAGDCDVYLLKTDSEGDTLWTRTYGGRGYDEGYSVQQTSDDGYIIVGGTESFGAGSCDVYLLRMASSGDTLWTRTYGGSSYEWGESVQMASDGGYIIAGGTHSFGAGGCDVYLLRTASSGDTLWTRAYGGSDADDGYFVQQTSDGGYIIAGGTYSFGAGFDDVYLVKTNSSGDTLWTRTYGGSDYDHGHSVQQTSDGGSIIAGASCSFSAGRSDVYLLKTDSSGDTLWTRTYGGTDSDCGWSIHQTTDRGYIIAGYTVSFGTANSQDVWLLKANSYGDTLWTRTYGGSHGDYGQSVQQTSDGGYIITGETDSFGAGNGDVYLLKVCSEELPMVSIELIPDQSPVVVPRGGSFGYTGTVTNNTEVRQRVDIWIMARVPGIGMYGPLREYSNVPFNPHQSRSTHLNQNIPDMAPISDQYVYYGYVGEYAAVVIDSSHFPFEVTAKGVSRHGSSDWTVTGSFLEADRVDIPTEFALSENHPNPFNARTVIEYQLPVSSAVTLEIYNLLGEKVTTLVGSEQQAGYRSVIWHASEVSSGIYFYKLTAGDFTETRRMMILK